MIDTVAHPSVTLILQIWAGLGPIIGGAVGHIVSRSVERERWIRDARTEEYRELLSALSALVVCLTGQSLSLDSEIGALDNVSRVLKDRLFIAPELKQRKVEARFSLIRDGLEGAGDFGLRFSNLAVSTEYKTTLEELINELTEMGRSKA